jgi:hypothetical protein
LEAGSSGGVAGFRRHGSPGRTEWLGARVQRCRRAWACTIVGAVR